MRPEAQAWWEQAQADLEAARGILELEHWYAAAFFGQQAAEKAVKALFTCGPARGVAENS